MPGSVVARRYARALFGLAAEENRTAAVLAELDKIIASLDQSAELESVLFRPFYSVAERCSVLENVVAKLGCSTIVKHFGRVLIEQGRMSFLREIRTEFASLVDAAKGQVTGEVISASPISEAQVAQLRQALSRRTGLDVQLKVEVDNRLLGGVVAKVGDLVFDGSLRTQLEQLRANLTKG